MNDLVKSNDTAIQAALIEVVKDKDIEPERLEKFLDLQIKLEQRQSKQAFNEAMAGFQGDCPIIARNKKVDFTAKSGNRTKYDYAPLDEIIHVIKPILKKHGLSYSFNTESNDDITTLITTISHISGHSENYGYQFNTIHDDQRMNLSQRRKSALSYAKRAALENALGVVTANDDDDARRAVDKLITTTQLDEIHKLMKEIDVKKKNFLAHLKVSALEELTEKEGKNAINLLKNKRIVLNKQNENKDLK